MCVYKCLYPWIKQGIITIEWITSLKTLLSYGCSRMLVKNLLECWPCSLVLERKLSQLNILTESWPFPLSLRLFPIIRWSQLYIHVQYSLTVQGKVDGFQNVPFLRLTQLSIGCIYMYTPYELHTSIMLGVPCPSMMLGVPCPSMMLGVLHMICMPISIH